MTNRNFFRAGSHYFICDVCGFKYHAEEKRLRWDNAVVCPECYEPRHSLDFIRTREDRQTVSNAKPRPTDSFIEVTYYFAYLEDQDDYVATDYIEDSDV